MNSKGNGRSIARRIIAAGIAFSLIGSLAPRAVMGVAAASPATGYTIAAKAQKNPDMNFNIGSIQENHDVSVTFVKAAPAAKSHTITASAASGGRISPSGSFGVRKGDDAVFTITPDSGYKILDVRVDGSSVGAVSSYTFKNVRAGHDIKATFQKNPANDLRITSALAKNITDTSATLVVKVSGSSKYTLYWETEGNSGYKQVNESKNKASYKLTGLKPGTTYSVRCVVTDNSGNQVVSSIVTFTTTGKKAGGGSTDTPKGDYPCSGIIKGGSVYIRSEASTSAKALTTFHKGDKVTVLGFVSSKSFVPGFYKIKWGSGVAYVAANYVDLVR